MNAVTPRTYRSPDRVAYPRDIGVTTAERQLAPTSSASLHQHIVPPGREAKENFLDPAVAFGYGLRAWAATVSGNLESLRAKSSSLRSSTT